MDKGRGGHQKRQKNLYGIKNSFANLNKGFEGGGESGFPFLWIKPLEESSPGQFYQEPSCLDHSCLAPSRTCYRLSGVSCVFIKTQPIRSDTEILAANQE